MSELHNKSHLRRRFWQKETSFECFWLETLPNRIKKKFVCANHEDEEMNKVCSRSSLARIYLEPKSRTIKFRRTWTTYVYCFDVSLLIWRLIWHNASRLSANELQTRLLLLCCALWEKHSTHSAAASKQVSERESNLTIERNWNDERQRGIRIRSPRIAATPLKWFTYTVRLSIR